MGRVALKLVRHVGETVPCWFHVTMAASLSPKSCLYSRVKEYVLSVSNDLYEHHEK